MKFNQGEQKVGLTPPYPHATTMNMTNHHGGPYSGKKPCNTESDCTGENETCHNLSHGSYCGTKFCRTRNDCLDIGHVTSGVIFPEECYNRFCQYSNAVAIS